MRTRNPSRSESSAAPGALNRPVKPAARRTLYREHDARGHVEALADHGEIDQTLPARARYCDEVLVRFAGAGIDLDALATQLQDDGAKSFDKFWNELLASIASKGETLKKDKQAAEGKQT